VTGGKKKGGRSRKFNELAERLSEWQKDREKNEKRYTANRKRKRAKKHK